jgi:hypothetical protein
VQAWPYLKWSHPTLYFGVAKKTKRRANHDGEVEPKSIQIAGADPKMMADAARYNVYNGAQIIDINMGLAADETLKLDTTDHSEVRGVKGMSGDGV